eukprot:COSAG02_NODE_50_length_44860_cov_203.992739_34_plen_78_part_00
MVVSWGLVATVSSMGPANATAAGLCAARMVVIRSVRLVSTQCWLSRSAWCAKHSSASDRDTLAPRSTVHRVLLAHLI